MLIFNELNTAFPWYDKLEKQNRYKEQGNGVCDYKLISPSDSLLPFQYRRVKNATPPVLWEVKEINSGATMEDITASLNLLKVATLGGYDYFYFNGTVLPFSLPFGFYYSQVTYADGSAHFSEMFHVPQTFTVATQKTSTFLRLEWYNSSDLSPFYFGDQTLGVPYFKNVCYLDTIITASEPEVTQENEKNGYEENITTFQRAVVPYLLTATVPDFLKIAMVLIPLHDVVILTTPGGVHDGEIKNIKTKTTIEEYGALSTVDLSFEQELVVIKTGCPVELLPDDCPAYSDPTLTSAVLNAGNVTLTGTAGTVGVWVDVYTSATAGGTYTLRNAGRSAAQLVAGTLVVPEVPGQPWFKVRLKNFNCDFGLSNSATS